MATEVTVTFVLNEDVTPELFAGKVANGVCRSGVLRHGEAVCIPGRAWLYAGETELELGGDPIQVPNTVEIPLLYSSGPAEVRMHMKALQERDI